MKSARMNDPPTSFRAEGGRFRWQGLAAAVVAALGAGSVYAWIAAAVQPHFAPLALFPILIGVCVGLTIVGFVRYARLGHRPTILLAAIVAGLAAAAGQHYFNYLRHVSAWQEAVTTAGDSHRWNLSAIQQPPTPSFGRYLSAQSRHGRPLVGHYVARGPAAWLCWAVEALLIVVAAVAVTLPAMRTPYCNRCGTWYRTVRGGRLDAITARRLAALLNIETVEGLHSPRYRLSTCHGGCGPTRCQLSWEDTTDTVNLAQVWLDTEQRRQVTEVLDEATARNRPASNDPPTTAVVGLL
jgi:hypothetical protein